jgi:NAD(P)-dependent dehydrogenase (short-subunit alcohol dehydrogenase family)
MSYKIVYPLTNEHYYSILLDHEPSDELIINTYNFIKSLVRKSLPVNFNANGTNSTNSTNSVKKIIKFIKKQSDSIVWLVLIKLLPYNIWIELYAECNALKYFWSDELLEKIIDSNRNAINLYLLNTLANHSVTNHNVTNHIVTNHSVTNHIVTNHSVTNHSVTNHIVTNHIVTNHSVTNHTYTLSNTHNVINLLNQYNLYWNFTQNVLNKRLGKYIKLLVELFDDIDFSNFISDQNLIKLLGNNNMWKTLNGKNKIYPKHILNFYPIKVCTIKLKQGIVYKTTDKSVYVYHDDIIVCFSKQIVNDNVIFANTNIDGIISFSEMSNNNITHKFNDITHKFNDTTHNTYYVSNIFTNAKLYQELNESNLIFENDDIKINNNEVINTIANQYAIIKFCKQLNYDVYIRDNIRHNYSKCYECKLYYDDRFCIQQYNSYCFECGIKNYNYMNERVNLSSFTAFITGIRVKIGFATALRILRNGGKVIGTTRYPNFALANYAKQPDYNVWKSNLTIIKCDFLNIDSVYKLLDIITSNKYRINAFINVAFRTIRSSNYYNNAVREIESALADEILNDNDSLINNVPNDVSDMFNDENKLTNQLILYDSNNDHQIDAFLNLSAINTNSMTLYRPTFQINIFGDVVDNVSDSSWDKKIDQIDPKEIVECTALNQLVPTLIINSLKPKLVEPKFVINVCSLEGQFSHNGKTDKHIHTNMCKSALNMLIRSLSEDTDPTFRAFSIDPGYVSGINTNPKINELPVSVHDGATKITWPIFKHYSGQPLDKDWIKIRNYEKESW